MVSKNKNSSRNEKPKSHSNASGKTGSGRKEKSKKTTSGLSPPKEKPSDKKSEDGVPDIDVDRTQWENTRFNDEAKGLITRDPDEIQRTKTGEATPLLMESNQIMLSRGEHLKQKPWITLILILVESIITVAVMIAWASFLEYNEALPIILCFANLLIALISIILIFSIEFCRFQVVKESLDESYRYRVPYEWKYWLCMAHILRFFLTCANMTIAALDDDFDGGAITVISAQPVVLILVISHVFLALRPQG